MKNTKFIKVIYYFFTSSILIQGLSFLRQSFITVHIGLNRQLDLYYTAFAVVTLFGLALNQLYENMMTSYAQNNRENDINFAFSNVLLAGLFASLLCCLSIFSLSFLLIKIFGAGFAENEQLQLSSLIIYFFPWIIVSAVYAVSQSILKFNGSYVVTIITDFATIAVSFFYLYVFKDTLSIVDIIRANTYGFLIALIISFSFSAKYFSFNKFSLSFIREICLRLAKQYTSSQSSLFISLAERSAFSFLPAGSISAIGLVSQITINLSSLLNFKDVYVYPIIKSAQRSLLFSRLMNGLFLAYAYFCLFISINSKDFIDIFFHYKKFTASDSALTASLLTISTLFLVLTIFTTPIFRLITIENFNRKIIKYYILSSVTYSILLLSALQFKILNPQVILMISGTTSFIASFYLVKQLSSLNIHYKLSSFFRQNTVTFIYMLVCAYMVSKIDIGYGVLIGLLIKGMAYTLLVSVYGFYKRHQLKEIISPSNQSKE